MTLVLDLPNDLQDELAAEAARLRLPLSEYVLRLLSAGRSSDAAPKCGAELVAYWQREGLIGSRPDISESQAHARDLRNRAQRRPRP